MSDLLVPIAISSQLDVTGEERIHAARYSPTTRPTYIPPEPAVVPFNVIVAQGGGGWAITEFNTADNTFTVPFVHAEPDVYYISRPWMMNNYIAIAYEWSAETSMGVAIYDYTGVLVDSIDNQADLEICGAVKMSETRFIVIWNKVSTDELVIDLCNFNGTTITVVDTVTIANAHGLPDYLQECVCQGDGIFLCTGLGTNRFLICKMSGDTLTTSFSTVGPSLFGSGISAIGNVIGTGKGYVYTYNGTDMTEVASTPAGPDPFICTNDGTRFFYAGFDTQSGWRLGTAPYTFTAIAQAYQATPGGGANYVFIPRDGQGFGVTEGGIFQFDGAAFTEIADFQFTQEELDIGDIGNMFATVVRVPA